MSGFLTAESQDFSEKEEVMTSFTDAGKGFFSDATEGELDEPEKEAEKAPWHWPFGGGSDNS